jgi:hypothetical protein
MEEVVDKFTIRLSDKGMVILSAKKERLQFTATEALMLLDILKCEEQKLKQMADEARPIPIQIKP